MEVVKDEEEQFGRTLNTQDHDKTAQQLAAGSIELPCNELIKLFKKNNISVIIYGKKKTY
tara:strand:+ start:3082 stop:3261 length:180 start_codon:yes stop_codon:yes gene_type:complete